VFILLPVKAHAAGFSTSLGANQAINAGSQFTITVSGVNATNLMGLVGSLSFDSSKISFVSASGLNGYTITVGSNLVADNTTGNTGTFGIATLTFRANGGFTAGQSTTISLSNVVGSDGVNNLSGTSSAVTISVAIPKSTNSDLSSLTVNNSLVSGFNSGTKYYTLTVNNNISSISIGATVADGRSWVSGIGSYALKVYSNTFYITVTSESGNRSVYTLTIIRKDANGLTAPLSTNNLLSSLVIENYNIGFDANKLEYALTVENNISSVKLTATPQDGKSKITTEGDFGNLEIGDNLVKIIVTAENGDKKTYTVTIKRKEEGPTTTLDQLIKVIDSTTAKQINVEIKDEKTVITSDMISSIKKNSKNLTINYYNGDSVAYKWEINGTAFGDISSMDVGISFDTDNKEKIANLTNYADNLYLNFAYSGALPNDTYVSINVSSKYKDGDIVNLYYYDDKANEIKLVYDDLKVKNGYLKFSIDHCSEYILSMANYTKENNDNSSYKTVCYFLGLAVICLTGKVVYDFLRKRQKNNLSK
jgi:hypothetical protein